MTEHTQPPPRTAGQHRGRARVWIAAAVWLLIGGVVWPGAVAGAVTSLHLSVAVANQGGDAAGAPPRREATAGPRALR